MVTRDLYEAHRTALLEDLSQIREEQKREKDGRAADRRMVLSALIAAALAFVIGILNVAVMNGIGG
ncbi:hypothetical protein ACIBG7_15290 [Nonomuraea sp. NPDC050328]|uniref:hypothetical protein n=1 Tax=Nonomuraea sp. NPDC050328 TaxID=3364361 RepID=UPI0037AE5BC2